MGVIDAFCAVAIFGPRRSLSQCDVRLINGLVDFPPKSMGLTQSFTRARTIFATIAALAVAVLFSGHADPLAPGTVDNCLGFTASINSTGMSLSQAETGSNIKWQNTQVSILTSSTNTGNLLIYLLDSGGTNRQVCPAMGANLQWLGPNDPRGRSFEAKNFWLASSSTSVSVTITGGFVQ